jgi:hypothetical protein
LGRGPLEKDPQNGYLASGLPVLLHSRSGHPDHVFTVRATIYPGDYAWVEIIDQGGAWTADALDDEHGRGLAIVAAVAGDGNWGIDGDAACRVAWFRLDWSHA